MNSRTLLLLFITLNANLNIFASGSFEPKKINFSLNGNPSRTIIQEIQYDKSLFNNFTFIRMHEYYYRNNGTVEKEIYYYQTSRIIYFYNETNDLLKVYSYGQNELSTKSENIPTPMIERDNNGNIIRKYKEINGKEIDVQLFYYDGKPRFFKKNYHITPEITGLDSITIFKNNKNFLYITRTPIPGDMMEPQTNEEADSQYAIEIFEFDQNGDKTSQVVMYNDRKIAHNFNTKYLEYDFNNNWIHRETYEGKELVLEEFRQIFYKNED